MAKYGHGFYKEYEEGDEDRTVFPEPSVISGMVLYHRYKLAAIPDTDIRMAKAGRHVYMVLCYCDHYGKLCADCASLNTTDFFGCSVPLSSADFKTLRHYVIRDCGWDDMILYQWIVFWIQQYTNRYHYQDALIFWCYPAFRNISLHRFFRYLYNFIVCARYRHVNTMYKKRLLYKYVSDTSADVRGGDVMIRLSIQLYGTNHDIISTLQTFQPQFQRRWNRIHWKKHDHTDTIQIFQQYHRKRFQACINSIKNEVAFRPSKVGMEVAAEHFQSQIDAMKSNRR